MAFRVTKASRDESAAVDEPGVGGEDEIGNVWRGLDELDRGAGGDKSVDETLPLLAGAVAVDRDLTVHPRIDFVGHREMVGPAHQITPAPIEAAVPILIGL